MALNKQAKVLTPKQVGICLNHLASTRNPLRDQVIFLLSVKAGLRAKEIANLTWKMLVDCDGEISSFLDLPNSASKGVTGGRSIPLNKLLKEKLFDLYEEQSKVRGFSLSDSKVIWTQRSNGTSPQSIVNMFSQWYKDLNLVGCSSHSGRRTFITNCSKKITTVGGSLRDVQYLAGHSSLQTTQRYIEGDSESKVKVVDLI